MNYSNLNAQVYQLEFSSNPLNFKYDKAGDSNRIYQTVNKIKNQYIFSSYIECNADSMVWQGTKVKVWLHIGPSYKMNHIGIYLDSQLNAYRTLSNKYENTKYDSLKVALISQEILLNLENTGYPFASVRAENKIQGNEIYSDLYIERGPFFTFDTCHIDGDRIVKKAFLEAYTGIREGDPYNEALFRKANQKLNQLPFLFSERTPQLAFIHGGHAKPYYYLRKKKSDQINGIVGLAPSTSSASNPTAATKIVLTGEFKIQLNNLFKSAKVLQINWKSFKARSQELIAYFSYPYIFNKPIGADIGLNLLKYDTLYTVLQRQIGLQYYTSGINGFKVFYKISSTNLNSIDTSLIRSSKQFPSINAMEIKNYGLSASFNVLDNRFNPRQGFKIEASGSVGIREILKDNQISEIKFGTNGYTLYDSNVLKNNQYQYSLRAENFFPLGKKATFKIGVQLNQIISPRIYFNELEREGGINSLKGFNEQSIFASNFNMLEFEYRYLLGSNSNVLVFWNGAYYEDKSYGRQNEIFDTPWGFGVGGNIETGAGILTLIYALGKEKNNPFDLRTGKFHFGLSSYF